MATIKATPTLATQFEALKAELNNIEKDITKSDNGNAAAGVRVRKSMQRVKVAAQGIRETVRK